MTTATTPTISDLERKIDELAAQVAFLADEAHLSRQRRERWQELQHDAMPIATEAMAVVERELQDLDVNVDDLIRLIKHLVRMAPVLDRTLAQVEMYADFAHELVPIGSEAMETATARLAVLEERGYFDFARGAVRVADKVVTGFTDEDVEALGDNVVLILETIKDLTQPEVMAALHRMISAVQEQQRHIAAEPADPPSLFNIIKQLRDPEIRRGIARGLNTLRAVSEAETGSHHKVNPTNTPAGGN
jgi:uncharacterized protein YjgD (DUF1641 family)